MKEKEKVAMVSLGRCACGGQIFASDTNDIFIAHSVPYCNQFEIMDVVDFLTYVRKLRYPEIDKKSS